MSYNGWTNRATWLVSMWLCEIVGDDALYQERDRILAELGTTESGVLVVPGVKYARLSDDAKTEAAEKLGEWIHEQIHELEAEYLPDNAYGRMVIDLIPDINYTEIAEHYFEWHAKFLGDE